jgi:opacity protein-like surface antigen
MKYLGFVLLVLSSSTTIALAETDTYIALNVGASIVDDAKVVGFTESTAGGQTITHIYDFGHTISMAAGVVDKDYGLRLEVEAANQINDLVGNDKYEELDITVETLLVNGYKDFYIFDKFLGYVSGGVGAAYHGNLADTVLAWQLGAGLGYELTKEITLNVGYRYLATDEYRGKINYLYDFNNSLNPFYDLPDENNTVNIHPFGSHNVTAGIRYSF